MNKWDAVVIGGGASGLSAALMLGRSRRQVLVIDAGSPRNRFASHMHGVLGNEGSSPAELLAKGRDEVAGYGVELVTDVVAEVEDSAEGLRITTKGGERYKTRALIVATGLTDQLPQIPGLAERWGQSVLHCPYCHGWEVRDRRLAVLGTSPMALHQVQLIRQLSDDVTLFTDGADYVDHATSQRLQSRRVKVVTTPVKEVLGSGSQVTGIRLDDGQEVAVDAIFTMGTLKPHDEFLAALDLKREDNPMGSFIAVDQMAKTSHPNIWAAGNVVEQHANVPMSIGAGSFVGASVNAALVAEDFDNAEREQS